MKNLIFDSMTFNSADAEQRYAEVHPVMGLPRAQNLMHKMLWTDETITAHGGGVPGPNVPFDLLDHVFKADGGHLSDNVLTYIDIESWPVDDPAPYVNALDQFHSIHPDKRTGFYGILPHHEFWGTLNGPEHPAYKEWQQHNDVLSVIAESADIIYPSLYTAQTDIDNWVRHATENLIEARRFGETVYAFIWPYYHQGIGPELSGQYVGKKYWNQMLSTSLSLADGVVIWNYRPDVEFDPNESWWKVTEKYL